ncbi:formate-dependent phosphoribosylglycinamide formyltransferase [Mycobacterium spongiae]|uniref:Formate-dependent phosphoribosylglycinamide formyltransferase n=1 Tax=Mycobacterium spongiae TaxID=886343 RepID=A0A975JUY9_9MYCO|nr:formate-dependent phosphoribosylglycinamide formyltransferase [Mycobacterium spongiae]QUR66141.1 formate-dependent phosphoribosylglycinamide formyltransferase [Mycobacterium spongiae]
MTEGLTEGQREPTGRHGRPQAAADAETTSLFVPPAVQPRHEPADSDRDDRSAARPRVLLLGSDERGRELVIALQRLGAEVIAIDDYPEAPAHRVADQSLVVKMTDADELAVVVERLHPDYLTTLTDAVAVDILDALETRESGPPENGFPQLVPGARSIRLTADREGLRRLAADELGLPTAPFWFVGSLGELEAVAAHAGFPLLVKPVAGAVGRGRSVVTGPDEVAPAWQRAVGQETAPESGPASGRVWAETPVDIEYLVTMIVVSSDGAEGPEIRFCGPIGHRGAEDGERESWQPHQMSAAALDAAKSIAARIVKALGGRGVFGVELMVNGDEVYFADVAAFPGESAWVTVRSQRLSAFELQARVILGLAVDTMLISPAAARVLSSAGKAPSAEALIDALRVPESDVRIFQAAGRWNRGGALPAHGVALATAPDLAAATDRAREIASTLNMRDSRG